MDGVESGNTADVNQAAAPDERQSGMLRLREFWTLDFIHTFP